MKIDQEKIGKFLSSLRGKMTQEELATKIGVSRDSVSKWERGLSLPSPESLLKLSEIFNISINEIYYGQRTQKSKINTIASSINHKMHQKRNILIGILIVILLLIIGYGMYYFANTYKSLNLYEITGEGENICLSDGYLLITKENIYFNINSIYTKNGEKIDYAGLYYDDKKESKILILSGIKANIFVKENYGTGKYFDLENMQDLKNNLYLEVEYGLDKKETIKLELNKIYTNDSLIFNKLGNIDDKEKEFSYDYISSNYKPLIKSIKESWPKEGVNTYKKVTEKEGLKYTAILDKDMLSLYARDNTSLEDWYYVFTSNQDWLYYVLYDDNKDDKVKCSFVYQNELVKDKIGDCSKVDVKAKSDFFWQYIYETAK